MGSFSMGKNIEDVQFPKDIVEGVKNKFLTSFQYQAPQLPENKVRMTFINLETVDGNKLPNVELYIDPTSIQVNKSVIQQKRLTKGGFVTQFWGHDLTKLQVTATTGNFQPIYGVAIPIPDTTKTTFQSWFNHVRQRWSKDGGPLKIFEKLKTWVYQNRFDQNNPSSGLPLIKLLWEDFVYEGYFTSFNYNTSSNEPFKINFDFAFTILTRDDISYKDIFGTISPTKLLGDPIGTISNTVKQVTDTVISKGKKELAKQAAKLPLLGDVATALGIDDIPNKMTLW